MSTTDQSLLPRVRVTCQAGHERGNVGQDEATRMGPCPVVVRGTTCAAQQRVVPGSATGGYAAVDAPADTPELEIVAARREAGGCPVHQAGDRMCLSQRRAW